MKNIHGAPTIYLALWNDWEIDLNVEYLLAH